MKKVLLTMLFALSMFLTIFSVAGVSYAKNECLVMGLIPVEDPKAMIEQYKPMKNWLEKEMGMCIQMFTAIDYTGIIEAMRAKKVDFAWFGPFSYALANERAAAEAFAVGVDKKGKSEYQSYLTATPEAAQNLGITKPLEGEAGMKVLAEKLNNHKKAYTFAFTDIASTSGYAVPRYYMHRAGIQPEQVFKKVGYVGTHDAAALAVQNKTVGLAAVYDIAYNKLIEKNKITSDSVVIIWKSPAIPGEPFAYRGDLAPTIKSALRDAIIKLPSHLTGSAKYVSYRLASDSEYAVIKDVKKVIDSLK